LENAQKELLIQAQQRAAQAQEGQKLNMAYQEQLARQRASGPAPATARTIAGNAVMPLLKGDLVTSRNGILQTLNDQPLENKKLYALYFAAKWCPTCRKFTPQLVEFYNRVAPTHPEFEVVFISSDRSAPAMEAYMRDAQMPWPALKYDQIAEKQGLLKYAGNGIPCLVVVDSTGRVISDSFAGKQYLGPMKVLADLETILGGSMPAAGVGQSR
jgi:nucleoredoxin